MINKTIEDRISKLKGDLADYENIEHNSFVCRHLNSENYIINGMNEYREKLRECIKIIDILTETKKEGK